MSVNTETTRVSVPEPFLRLLLQYFAEGIGEGEKLAETLLKNFTERPQTDALPEDVDKLVQWALESGNKQLAKMIGTFLRTPETGPHEGLTFKEKMLSVARR
jgi:hypothetical protein